MSQLREFRKRKNLTLTDVRLMIGVDTGSLSRMERGESYPRVKTAKRLAELYNISLGDVFNAIPSQPVLSTSEQRAELPSPESHSLNSELQRLITLLLSQYLHPATGHLQTKVECNKGVSHETTHGSFG